jgi:hypothetical protein
VRNSKYTSALLREKLGETLDSLLDKDNPMDLERAKVVADVAQVMINIAKVEIDHMKVSGGEGTGFIVEQEKEIKLPSMNPVDQLTAKADSAKAKDDDIDSIDNEIKGYLTGMTATVDGVKVHKGSRY